MAPAHTASLQKAEVSLRLGESLQKPNPPAVYIPLLLNRQRGSIDGRAGFQLQENTTDLWSALLCPSEDISHDLIPVLICSANKKK